MFLKRKSVVIISLLLCICILSEISTGKELSAPASAKPSEQPQIILDAGHPGFS